MKLRLTNTPPGSRNPPIPRYPVLVLAACLLAAMVPHTHGDSLVDREFEFASGLISFGFPDLAEKVVAELERKYPGLKDRVALIRAEILISRGKLEEARKILQSLPPDSPKAQAISLALATGYYRAGQMEEAKKIYQGFFEHFKGKVPADPDLKRFYQESAYRFGQLLEKAGDLEAALEAYSRVLATKPGKSAERKLMVEMAGLYVKLAEKESDSSKKQRYLNEARSLCEKIQWGGLDLWFGQSLIIMADIKLAQGDRKGAEEFLRDNLDLLKEIDHFLKENNLPLAESPMAGARYLLGTLYEERGRKMLSGRGKRGEAVKVLAKALREYFNVFAKYGESEWGSKAAVRGNELKSFLESLGKTVKVDFGAYRHKVSATEFRLADELFAAGKYDDAVREYIRVLTGFPESEQAPRALGNLARAYAIQGRHLWAMAVCGYLGDRFAEKEDAGLALLGVGKWYFDHNMTNQFLKVYDIFLDRFRWHPRAPGVAFTLAGLLKKTGRREDARRYYDLILARYQKSKYFLKALDIMAWESYQGGDYSNAVVYLKQKMEALSAGHEKARTRFQLADALLKMKRYGAALKEFEGIIRWLVPKDSVFNASAVDAEKNRQILEKAVFFRGYCLALIARNDQSRAAEARLKAERTLQRFLTSFPRSKLAPLAMSVLGEVQLGMGKYEEATKTFDALAERYPESPEGQRALFELMRAALEVGKHQVARDALGRMVKNASKYKPGDFARVGQLMLDAGLYREAVEAFRRALTAQERAVLERSLFGLARAYFELGDYQKAAEFAGELLEKYPRSALFYDAKFVLGQAYRRLGRAEEAIQALSDVFRYADDSLLINRANLLYGEINEKKGDLKAALASYQRIALLSDPERKDLRPMIEQALLRSIELGDKLGLYQDVIDACDRYLKLFPEGEKIDFVRKAKAEARLKGAQAQGTPAAESGG